MSGYDQTLRPFLWRAETIYPDREIVARTYEGIHRYTYVEYADRTRQLANALAALGVDFPCCRHVVRRCQRLSRSNPRVWTATIPVRAEFVEHDAVLVDTARESVGTAELPFASRSAVDRS